MVKSGDFKKEDFELKDTMDVILLTGIEKNKHLFHDIKKDIYGNTLLKRKKDFDKLILESLKDKYGYDIESIQLPSNISSNMIRRRILEIKKIPYTNIELAKIMNRLETKIKILDCDGKIIDVVKINIKDDYYYIIYNLIINIDINNFLNGDGGGDE